MNLDQLIGIRHTRRAFLGHAAGIGTAALAALLDPALLRAAPVDPRLASLGIVNPLHFAPKAKRIIHLYQAGGPSHLETFDHKPRLAALDGQPMPESYTKGQPIAQLQGQQLKCFAPQFPFQKSGASGQEICTLFPHIASIADEICIARSMVTEAINHDPAHTYMNTGTTISGRPSMGSWLLYGLGSECEDLPGFVVLSSLGKGGQGQPIASRQWHSGFLPSKYQGVEFRSTGDPVHYVGNPKGVNRPQQRDIVDAAAAISVKVHDHLVIGRERVDSFRSLGLL
ncbi:MAG: DUF1501 domain-containing protein [Pirellulales bacterium]|nr:DUF1501 domain-containing protein [Pirellulales bacterium]